MSSAHANAHATADGSAVQAPKDSSGPGDSSAPADSSAGGASGAPADSTSGVSIGVAVAINYVRVTNEARAPPDSTVSANGAAIEALTHSQNASWCVCDKRSRRRRSRIAGSVAIEIENIQTSASLEGWLNAGSGDVSVRAASDSTTSTSALPSDSTGGVSGASSVGIGASVAVALVDDTTIARITGTLIGGGRVTIAAGTTHLMTTHAKTGAAGGKSQSCRRSR